MAGAGTPLPPIMGAGGGGMAGEPMPPNMGPPGPVLSWWQWNVSNCSSHHGYFHDDGLSSRGPRGDAQLATDAQLQHVHAHGSFQLANGTTARCFTKTATVLIRRWKEARCQGDLCHLLWAAQGKDTDAVLGVILHILTFMTDRMMNVQKFRND